MRSWPRPNHAATTAGALVAVAAAMKRSLPMTQRTSAALKLRA
jgi:hypothetical protein